MEIDEESLGDFLEESTENLDELDVLFIELEKSSNDTDVLGQIFRAVHTMKGSASFLGFKNLESFCHAAEEVLDLARSGQLEVGTDHVTLLLKAMDVFRYAVKYIEENKAEPNQSYPEVTEQLKSALNKESFDPSKIDLSYLGESEPSQSTQSNEDEKVESIEDHSEEEVGVVEVTPVEEEVVPLFESNDQSSEELDNTEDSDQSEQSSEDDWAEEEEERFELPQLQIEEKKAVKAYSENKKIKGADSSIRVDVELLDKLMNMVGELVLARNQLNQQISQIAHSGVHAATNSISLITTELQEGIMKTRMQPIGNVLNKFSRVVRDLAVSLGKEASLIVNGKDTELDRSLMEAIRDPLTHIIRNSVDHGLELPEGRELAGKDREGHIVINAYHEGGQVVIEIKDDGKGLDREKIIEKVVEKNLANSGELEKMNDQEIFSFIFEPGFSTTDEISKLSGRGVGMDVVRTNIAAIGGTVDLQSENGKGTTFYLQIPLTLAIIPALIVKSNEESFVIPQISLLELILLRGEELNHIEQLKGSEVYRLRGKLLPVVRLNKLLNRESSEKEEQAYIVVLSNGAQNFGLVVDEVEDSGEIVVKPLNQHFESCKIFAGATLMGNGDISLILDIAAIAGIVNLESRENRNLTSNIVTRTKNANTVLLFTVGGAEQFGVQLSQVTRLEQFNSNQIEMIGSREAMRYRGGILPLLHLSSVMNIDEDMQGEEELNLIVFKSGGREVGLIVKDIVDTTEMEGELNVEVYEHPIVLGAMMLKNEVTLLLDLLKVFDMLFPELAQKRIMNEQAALRQSKILFVDDSAFYRKVVSHYLDPEYFTVTTAKNGKEGLECIEENEFDLFIIDLEMPVMDGNEMIREIRKKRSYDKTPVMVMTALTSGHDRNNAIKNGIQSYIVKLDKEELLNEIFRLLHLKRAAS